VQIMSGPDHHIMPDDDYFCLLPGETREVGGDLDGEVKVTAWNTDEY
jgi:hypothetical protein